MATMGEIYLPLSVGFPRDPKIRALMYEHGQEGILAAYLYIMMCLYCRENLTDGWVPAAEIPALAYPLGKADAERFASVLLASGLVSTSDGSRATAMRVAAYVKRNGTRQDALRRSEQAKHAGRSRWRKHDAEGAGSGTHSERSAKTETESYTHPSPSPEPGARAREAAEPPRERDLPDVVIYEIREATGGLTIGRERAAEIAAEIIGARKLTAPAAYVRKAIREAADPFALTAANGTRRRRNTAADTPAAEVSAKAATVDGRRRPAPATAEQRKLHADAARAALAKVTGAAVPAITDVPLPDEPDAAPF